MSQFDYFKYVQKNKLFESYDEKRGLLTENAGEEVAQHDRAMDLVDNSVIPILGDIRDYMASRQNLNISKPSEAMRALLDISDYFDDTPELAKTISDMYEDGFAPEDIASFFYTDHSDALNEDSDKFDYMNDDELDSAGIGNDPLGPDELEEEYDEEAPDGFENPEELPQEVQDLMAKWEEEAGGDDLSYAEIKAMQMEFEDIGWTFDYGLDAIPYGLRPLAQKESFNQGATDIAMSFSNTDPNTPKGATAGEEPMKTEDEEDGYNTDSDLSMYIDDEEWEKEMGRGKEEIKEDWGSSDQGIMNRSIHKDLGMPTKMPMPFDDYFESAVADAVDFYWDEWEEYAADRDELIAKAKRAYYRQYFPEEFEGFTKMFS